MKTSRKVRRSSSRESWSSSNEMVGRGLAGSDKKARATSDIATLDDKGEPGDAVLAPSPSILWFQGLRNHWCQPVLLPSQVAHAVCSCHAQSPIEHHIGEETVLGELIVAAKSAVTRCLSAAGCFIKRHFRPAPETVVAGVVQSSVAEKVPSSLGGRES